MTGRDTEQSKIFLMKMGDALPTVIDGKKSVLEQLEANQRKAQQAQEQSQTRQIKQNIEH